ncbi:hypothetical protein EV360DRAFT_84811 [Lentinula raphanica]|nr:hypothetical protein EV360DRAFT_84811 [Lentinula raphanica]
MQRRRSGVVSYLRRFLEVTVMLGLMFLVNVAAVPIDIKGPSAGPPAVAVSLVRRAQWSVKITYIHWDSASPASVIIISHYSWIRDVLEYGINRDSLDFITVEDSMNEEAGTKEHLEGEVPKKYIGYDSSLRLLWSNGLRSLKSYGGVTASDGNIRIAFSFPNANFLDSKGPHQLDNDVVFRLPTHPPEKEKEEKKKEEKKKEEGKEKTKIKGTGLQ